MQKLTLILTDLRKKPMKNLVILALIVISLCGCGQQKVSTPNISEAESYAKLTESDKQLYNNLLLKVLPQFDHLGEVQIASIRVGSAAGNYSQLYYLDLVYDAGTGDTEDYFYAFGNKGGYSILVPVSFEDDPTEWDFAEESKYDIKGLNDTIQAHSKELEALKAPANVNLSELRSAMNKCRTFFYRDGEIESDHVITRVDLEDGQFNFTTMTSKGMRISDRVLEYSLDGSYDVEISPDGIAYLVLKDREKCLIQFDGKGNISGIRATGYKNFAGEVSTLELQLTDRW